MAKSVTIMMMTTMMMMMMMMMMIIITWSRKRSLYDSLRADRSRDRNPVRARFFAQV